MSEEIGTIEKEYATLTKEFDELEVKHAEALHQMSVSDAPGNSVITIYENIEKKCLRYLKHWPDMECESPWADHYDTDTVYPIVERLSTIFQKTFHAYNDREMRHMRGSNLNGFVWSPKHHISSFNGKLAPMLIIYEYNNMSFDDEAKEIYKKTGGVEPSTLPTSCNLAELKTYATTKAAFRIINEYKQEVVALNQRLTKLYGNKYVAYLNLNPDIRPDHYFFDTGSKVIRWEDPSVTEIRKKKRIEERESARKGKSEGDARLQRASTKIKKVIKGHMTRSSSIGKAVSKQIQRYREYKKSRREFHDKYSKIFETIVGSPDRNRRVRSMPLTLKSKKNKLSRTIRTY
jgi:hypothetical protein